jgi:heptosyltransferase-2
MADGSFDFPRRILVQAPNWLGDVVMTTPLLDRLHRNSIDPPLEIHLGVRRAWAPLFRDDSRLSGLVVHERRGRHGGLAGIRRHAQDLKRHAFDAVLLGPPSLRSALVALLAGVPRRIGHRGDGRDLLLTTALRRHARGSVPYPAEMLELAGPLGLTPVEGPPGQPSLPGCDAVPPRAFAGGDPLIAVAPGTTYGEAKTWPVAQVSGLLDLATREHRVVLVGDAPARTFTRELARGSGLRWGPADDPDARVIDLCGATDLLEAVGVLKACRGFVGNDSGLMHLAGALGTATVGVFGSSNPDWTAPGGPRTAAVAAQGYACRPCYRRTCNQPRFCLLDVEPAAVFAVLADLMERAPSRGESP